MKMIVLLWICMLFFIHLVKADIRETGIGSITVQAMSNGILLQDELLQPVVAIQEKNEGIFALGTFNAEYKLSDEGYYIVRGKPYKTSVAYKEEITKSKGKTQKEYVYSRKYDSYRCKRYLNTPAEIMYVFGIDNITEKNIVDSCVNKMGFKDIKECKEKVFSAQHCSFRFTKGNKVYNHHTYSINTENNRVYNIIPTEQGFIKELGDEENIKIKEDVVTISQIVYLIGETNGTEYFQYWSNATRDCSLINYTYNDHNLSVVLSKCPHIINKSAIWNMTATDPTQINQTTNTSPNARSQDYYGFSISSFQNLFSDTRESYFAYDNWSKINLENGNINFILSRTVGVSANVEGFFPTDVNVNASNTTQKFKTMLLNGIPFKPISVNAYSSLSLCNGTIYDDSVLNRVGIAKLGGSVATNVILQDAYLKRMFVQLPVNILSESFNFVLDSTGQDSTYFGFFVGYTGNLNKPKFIAPGGNGIFWVVFASSNVNMTDLNPDSEYTKLTAAQAGTSEVRLLYTQNFNFVEAGTQGDPILMNVTLLPIVNNTDFAEGDVNNYNYSNITTRVSFIALQFHRKDVSNVINQTSWYYKGVLINESGYEDWTDDEYYYLNVSQPRTFDISIKTDSSDSPSDSTGLSYEWI